MAVLSGAGHQFIEQPSERAGRDAIERVVAFLGEHIDNPQEAAAAVPACDAEAEAEADSPPSTNAHSH